MSSSEQPRSLETAEILELAGVLSKVNTWIQREENASFHYEFNYSSFARQVCRVFEARRGIHISMQKPSSVLLIKPWQREVNPMGTALEQQARDAFAELFRQGFEVLDPRRENLNLQEKDEGAIEFTIGLGGEVANFVAPDMGAIIGGPSCVNYPNPNFHPTRVRLYPWENSLPDENGDQEGGLMHHLRQIEHECVVAIPSMDSMEGNAEACGYAFYQIMPGSETPVVKLNVDTPLTRKDNRDL